MHVIYIHIHLYKLISHTLKQSDESWAWETYIQQDYPMAGVHPEIFDKAIYLFLLTSQLF